VARVSTRRAGLIWQDADHTGAGADRSQRQKGGGHQDQAEFHGTYVSFGPAYSWPKPVQRPHPPIVIGGESEAALDRLLRYGDEWLPRGHTKPERIREVRQWLADNGRGHVPCTVFGPSGPEAAGRFAEADVERVALMLPTMPEAETLAALDRLAEGVQPYR
jgi:alkanesulfonate monooxygenase SsuD/methylene tetrahydromethanopterin reductase-like flavin-dependent oxidoreductase (luciferase family)